MDLGHGGRHDGARGNRGSASHSSRRAVISDRRFGSSTSSSPFPWARYSRAVPGASVSSPDVAHPRVSNSRWSPRCIPTVTAWASTVNVSCSSMFRPLRISSNRLVPSHPTGPSPSNSARGGRTAIASNGPPTTHPPRPPPPPGPPPDNWGGGGGTVVPPTPPPPPPRPHPRRSRRLHDEGDLRDRSARRHVMAELAVLTEQGAVARHEHDG